MEATASVGYGKNGKAFVTSLSPLQVAEIVANAHGYYDLDVDTDDRGVLITVSGHNRLFTARGRSLTMAVENMINTLVGE